MRLGGILNHYDFHIACTQQGHVIIEFGEGFFLHQEGSSPVVNLKALTAVCGLYPKQHGRTISSLLIKAQYGFAYDLQGVHQL